MGNVFDKLDEEKRDAGRREFADHLTSIGIDPPTEQTELVPDFPDGPSARDWFGLIGLRGLSTKKQMKLFRQKFTIAGGEPYSFYERKRMSLLSPENPFLITQGDGEAKIFKVIESQLPLRKGGLVPKKKQIHRFMLQGSRPDKIFNR